MSSAAIASMPMLVPAEIVPLQEVEFVIGTLYDVVYLDGQDTCLARIAGELIDLPLEHLAKLRGYLGKRVVVGLLLEKYRVELSSR